MSELTLYTYPRSSAAFRVRIALNIKNLPSQSKLVHLLNNGGEHHQESYLDINPQGLVPTLKDGDVTITQSLAIIEYLNECHPEPKLLADDPTLRAKQRGFAYAISCDIHPLNNLRVLNYLNDDLGIGQQERHTWYQHWISTGFQALETQLKTNTHSSAFCFGNTPSIADVCLIPQIYNAIRFECDLSKFPTLTRIYHHCMEIEAFIKAAPENQPDQSNIKGE